MQVASGQVKNIWRRKILVLWRDAVKGEGEKGVGFIHAMRCEVGKKGKEAGCEIGNIGEVHIGSAVATTNKVITTKERTKRTLISFNTSSFAVHSILSFIHAAAPRNSAVHGTRAVWHVGSFGRCMGACGHEGCVCFEENTEGEMRDGC